MLTPTKGSCWGCPGPPGHPLDIVPPYCTATSVLLPLEWRRPCQQLQCTLEARHKAEASTKMHTCVREPGHPHMDSNESMTVSRFQKEQMQQILSCTAFSIITSGSVASKQRNSTVLHGMEIQVSNEMHVELRNYSFDFLRRLRECSIHQKAELSYRGTGEDDKISCSLMIAIHA